MRAITFFVLLVITGAAVYGAYTVVMADRRAAETPVAAETGPLFPALMARVNDVARVSIRTAEETVTVVRGADGRWAVAEKANFPADANDVKETVVGVASLRRLEPRTAKPELYGRLGVADVTEPGSKAVRITLADAGGTVLADVLRGTIDQAPAGGRAGTLYVRQAEDPQSWYAAGNLPVPTKVNDWLVRSLPQVDRDRVASVRIRHPDGTVVETARSSATEANFALADIPAGKRPKAFDVNGLAGAIEFLTLQDVAAVDAIDFSGAVETVITTFDGLAVTARTVQVDGKPWIAFAAQAVPAATPAEPAAAAPEAAPATPAEGAAAPAAGGDAAAAAPAPSAAEAVQAEAATLNQRYGRWAFQVSDYSAAQLTKKPGDLVEDPPAETPATAPEGTPPASGQ